MILLAVLVGPLLCMRLIKLATMITLKKLLDIVIQTFLTTNVQTLANTFKIEFNVAKLLDYVCPIKWLTIDDSFLGSVKQFAGFCTDTSCHVPEVRFPWFEFICNVFTRLR